MQHGAARVAGPHAKSLRRGAGYALACAVLGSCAPFPVGEHPLPYYPLVAENRIKPYTAVMPGCDDPAVAQRIRDGFEQKERVYWNSPVYLGEFHRPREIDYRPYGPTYIPRRYCAAEVELLTSEPPPGAPAAPKVSKGYDVPPRVGGRPPRVTVNYIVGEDTGFAGGLYATVSVRRPASYGVTWCVVGYDRNFAYNPACKEARP